MVVFFFLWIRVPQIAQLGGSNLSEDDLAAALAAATQSGGAMVDLAALARAAPTAKPLA